MIQDDKYDYCPGRNVRVYECKCGVSWMESEAQVSLGQGIFY